MLAKLKRVLALAPGWRTSRRLLVLQSDDWFSIRSPNANALSALKALGAEVDRCHYMKYDSFESEEDLSGLFEILASVLDFQGKPAQLTANCLSANPDFARIEASGFTTYHSESSLQTASKISCAGRNMQLWQEAIRAGVCEPQSHGREHLNVRRWLEALRNGKDEITKAAFDHGMFGVSGHVVPQERGSFLAAFDTTGDPDPPNLSPIVDEALSGFKTMFGAPSRSFIAPNYVWSNAIEEVLHHNGVEYIQSGRMQWYPGGHGVSRGRRRRFLGHSNDLGQIYLVRNVDFEPSSDPSADWQDQALSQISLAFGMRKPAIISTHRVNFMGGLDSRNRDRGLRDLLGLLRAVVKKWPSVEFLSTTELGDLIRKDGRT